MLFMKLIVENVLKKNMYSKVKMIVFDFGTESDSEVEVRNYKFKLALAGN